MTHGPCIRACSFTRNFHNEHSRLIRPLNFGHVPVSFLHGIQRSSIQCKKFVEQETCTRFLYKCLDYIISIRGGSTGGGGGPPEKNVPPPHFSPASLDFHLNRPVISLFQLQNTPVVFLIQLHIVPPAPSWNCGPHWPHLASARTAPDQHKWKILPLRNVLPRTCAVVKGQGQEIQTEGRNRKIAGISHILSDIW